MLIVPLLCFMASCASTPRNILLSLKIGGKAHTGHARKQQHCPHRQRLQEEVSEGVLGHGLTWVMVQIPLSWNSFHHPPKDSLIIPLVLGLLLSVAHVFSSGLFPHFDGAHPPVAS